MNAEQIQKALQTLDARHDALNRQLVDFLESKSDTIEDHGKYIVSNSTEMDTLAKQMVDTQSQINSLRDALKAVEQKAQDVPQRVDRALKYKGIARSVTEHEGWKHMLGKPGPLRQAFDLKDVGYAWARKELNDFDNANNPGLVKPWYRPDIIEYPKNRPVFRDLFPVVQIPVATNSVSIDRELVEYAWVARLTAAVIATATTAPLSTVVGLDDAAPFNSLTFDDGTNSETVAISSITDNTVTFAPALANGYAVADTRVSSDYYLCTAEGEQKPQSLDKTEVIVCPVCKLASWEKASMEILEDDTRTQLFINRRLLSRQARNEDKAILYGPGGTQIEGIFNVAAVPTFNFSGSETGATKIDHLINCLYQLAESNYMGTAATVTPRDMRDIVKQTDSTGAYIFVRDISASSPDTLLAVQLIMTNQLERNPAEVGGDFVVGDFDMAGSIYDRLSDRFEVGLDGNDFTTNMRTLLIERRFCFAVEQPLALIKGTFDSQP